MDLFSQDVDIVIYNKPIRIQTSFNGLVTISITELQLKLEDNFYVFFINRKRNQFKILFQHLDHISVFTMRLEGPLPLDYTKTEKINSRTLKELVKISKSRYRLYDISRRKNR